MLASIIIPAHNSEKTISGCLNSLINQQTEKKFEIIIVDDGSIDSTAKEIKKIKNTKIKYLCQKNSGPAKARNLGAKKSNGNIILFIDSDCVAEKNWLEEMLKPFSDKNVAAVQGAYKTKQKEFAAQFSQIEIEERYERMEKAKKLDWVGSYSAAYRAEVFRKMNGFDESFPIASGEDPELSYKISEKGYKISLNSKAIVYHSHPKTLLQYLKTKFFRAYYRPRMYSKHKAKMISDSYTPQTLKLQILCFYALILGIVLIPFSGIWAYIVLSSILAHLLLGTNFFIFALKKNFLVAAASPTVLFLRSVVFGIGLVWGKLNG
ncbi:MAG: glycosyltransferase [Candidatus Diapherotrites archaeon]|nr:glycosyltransferase [Candidatus Diapherotrites archaeon]